LFRVIITANTTGKITSPPPLSSPMRGRVGWGGGSDAFKKDGKKEIY